MKSGMNRHWLVAVALCMTPFAYAAPPDFSHCQTCHGADGNGNTAIRAPRISGIEPWYMRRQIDAFAAGRRGVLPADMAGHEMQPVAARLRDSAQTEQLVAFVGRFTAKPAPVTITGDINHGKSLYAVCAGCHGERADGNAALDAPALSGRTDWYMVTQLKNFAAGLRGTDEQDVPAMQMRAAAMTLPDANAINDVVAYINTLR